MTIPLKSGIYLSKCAVAGIIKIGRTVMVIVIK